MTDRHHALIAGTGRAGTSFLTKFLVECGVPAGDPDDLVWFDEARAGLERNLLDSPDAYLVKDPWFVDYMHLVDLDEVTIDVLILPVRDLRAAAVSRVRLEQAHIQQTRGRSTRVRHAANVPGGMIHDLSVQDQERVLAVGQASLITWALEHSVPLVLLHHPRLVSDRDYLIDSLWPWLGRFCDRDTALQVFDRVADVRPWATSALTDDEDERDSDRVVDLRVQIEGLATALDRTKAELASVRSERDELGRTRDDVRRSCDAQLEALRNEVIGLQTTAAGLQDRVSALVVELDAESERANSLAQAVDALQRSRALRLGRAVTSPIRVVRRVRRR